MKKYIYILIIAVFAAACQEGDKAENLEEKSYKRLVTLGGTMTEVVYKLGKDSMLVGVDVSSIYPEAADTLPKVGVWRMVTPEAVLGLQPDLVLAMPDAGPIATLDKIEASEATLYHAKDGYSVDWTKELINDVSELLEAEDKGQEIISKIQKSEDELDSLKQEYGDGEDTPTALFLYVQGGKVYMVGGKGTTADAMMKESGVRNLAEDLEEWQNVGPEYTLSKNPDILIVAMRGMESIDGAESLNNIPGIGEMDAVRNGKVYIVDDLAFLGYGPRVVQEQIALFKYSRNLE